MNSQRLKETLLEHCTSYVQKRLERIKNTMSDIAQSLTSETKSTAGDKHETGRAMLQLEREKAGQQLAEIQKLQGILSKININANSDLVHLGSVVITSKANYFISISVGELQVEEISYYAIAANSPIGRLLLGKRKGEKFSFNQTEIKIDEVL